MKSDLAKDIVVAVLVVLVLISIGFRVGVDFIHVEAVEKGHAEWVVQPNGSTVFTWKSDLEKKGTTK